MEDAQAPTASGTDRARQTGRNRIRAWFRARPWVLDLAVALGVLAYELPVSLYPRTLAGPTVTAISLVVSVAMCALYPLHRRHPLGVFCGIAAGAWIGVLLGWALVPAPMILFAVMLYHLGTRFSWRVLMPATALVAVWWVIASVPYVRVEWARVSQIGLVVLANVLIALGGALVRSRRARLRALQDRAERLVRERDAQARIATAEERARIARELHDIVAHSLGTMTVMADGASRVAESDPDRGSRMMAQVRDTGRTAMTDMRRMLDVLRADDAASRAPQPGLQQLDRLLDEARATGLRVDFAAAGRRVELPTGLDLAAYRIVQEALTNARRHGGPMLSTVEVILTYHEEAIELKVSDDGQGMAPEAAGTGSAGAGSPPTTGRTVPPPGVHESAQRRACHLDPAPGLGHGIIGMRERATAYGGSLQLRHRPDGGFEVHAMLPIGDAGTGAEG